MSTGDIIMIQTLMLQFLSPLFFLGSTYRNFIDTFVELKELFDTMKKLAEVIEGQK
jgi:ABC-type transport system involved in Fe-S cluster assembly fused permease/ATPase subunit